MEVEIIYEDNDVLAVNKPAGLKVHGDESGSEETLSDWILARNPEMKNVGKPLTLLSGKVIPRPGIVHRLDKDTSGVLVIGKKESAFEFLKKQFQDRSLKKTYRAVVYGEVKGTTGIINKPIGRRLIDFRKRAIKPDLSGDAREALTQYKVLSATPDYSYLEVYPKTGRTHQIRVHLKSIGHPIVCDKLYTPKRPCPAGLSRQALHASQIELTLPIGGRILLEAPEPKDFRALLAALKLV